MKPSRNAAIRQLAILFSSSDVLTFEEIVVRCRRTGYDWWTNKTWLNHKLTLWKAYHLAYPFYGVRNEKRVVAGVQLAPEGKQAVEKAKQPSGTIILPGREPFSSER